jgi:hypothetical protein
LEEERRQRGREIERRGEIDRTLEKRRERPVRSARNNPISSPGKKTLDIPSSETKTFDVI